MNAIAMALLFGVSVSQVGVSAKLQEPILTPGQTRMELEAFVHSRLPALRVPEDAEAWALESERLRHDVLDRVVFRGVPSEWIDGPLSVEWLDTIDRFDGYSIRKLRYEAVPGMWIPALLYMPDDLDGRVPAVLNLNGHTSHGKSVDYKQIRCINLAKRGMLALSPEWYGMGELATPGYGHDRIAYIDLVGVSGLSMFYLSMKRGLDVLEAQPNTDPERIAVTGLSGGGWQTIVISSLDKRVALAAPNAGYIGTPTRIQFGEDIGDLEQLPTDLLSVTDYTHLTAMRTPRPTLLIYNTVDECCFQSYRARPSVYDSILPFFRLFDASEQFVYHENADPGTHNYDLDNRQQFYAFLNKNFGLAAPNEEIPSEGEVLTRADLDCGVPDGNETFITLAQRLAADLPRSPAPSRDSDRFAAWANDTREALRQVLRVDDSVPEVMAAQMKADSLDGIAWGTFKLRIGEWTLPAVSFAREGIVASEVVVIASDAGRASRAEDVAALLDRGATVLAIDPVYCGEAMFDAERNTPLAMFVQSVGGRLLGMQAEQLATVCAWARTAFQAKRVTLDVAGKSLSTAALTSKALFPDVADDLNAPDAPASLKEPINEDAGFAGNASLYCFGLLEVADIDELRVLAGI